jgi:phosphoglycerate kinase
MHDGHIDDDLRITSVLPTINWLRDQKVVVVLAGHLGRPKGVVDPLFSMAPVAKRFGELLRADVVLAPEIYGFKVEPILASAAPGDVVMLENLRFDPGEEECSPAFCANLSGLFDAYVNDAFGASHRAHASIVGPPKVKPHAAGRLLGVRWRCCRSCSARRLRRSSRCSVAPR